MITCSLFYHKMFCFCFFPSLHQWICVIWNSPDWLNLVRGEDPSQGLAAKKASEASLEPSSPPGRWLLPRVRDVEASREDDPKVESWTELAAAISLIMGLSTLRRCGLSWGWDENGGQIPSYDWHKLWSKRPPGERYPRLFCQRLGCTQGEWGLSFSCEPDGCLSSILLWKHRGQSLSK